MTYFEINGDLFAAPQGTYLAHCISGDYALGAGIAKTFDKVYNMRYKLHKNYPIEDGKKFAHVGEALLVDNVFNLVTKPRCYHKPRIDDVYDTLLDMKEQCEEKDITKLSMPTIGAGLDKLNWNEVRDMIQEVFEDTDVDIYVYVKNQKDE